MTKSPQKPQTFLAPRYVNRSALGGKRLNYKSIAILKQFTTAQGKIVARPISQLTSKQQRKIAQHIKYARILALIPFVANN